MPAPLSTGNRQYNQMRRIHPHDTIAKLDYYLSPPQRSASSSLASSLAPTCSSDCTSSTSNEDSRNNHHHLRSSDSGRSYDQDSYYNTALNRALRRRRKGENVARFEGVEDGKRELFRSPVDTSGFSEGTIVEDTYRESFGKFEALQVGLGNFNWSSRDAAGNEQLGARGLRSRGLQPYAKRKSEEIVGSSPLSSSPLSPPVMVGGGGGGGGRRSANNAVAINRQNLTRFKRRNNRFNHRGLLLDGGDHLVNPYALSELFSQSEIPGFREIFASDSYLRKFCWIVAFLFMTVLSLNDMTELITEYYEYPITVDVRLRDSSRLPFPSVTVCNLNVVRFSALCSSTPGSRYELASQIPSELRDKLCGIQVDKKNATGETDISDINNIGITTTTTTTSTTTTTAASTTTETEPLSSTTTTTTSATGEASSTGGPGQTTTGNDNWPQVEEASSRPATFEHKTLPKTTESPAPTSQSPTRRVSGTGSNGALDLGDTMSGDASLSLLLDGGRGLRSAGRGQGRKQRRSIRFTETEIRMDESQPRPFASAKRSIRLRLPSTQQPRHSSAGQLGKLSGATATGQANRDRPTGGGGGGNRNGHQPGNGQANPGSVPMNPLLTNLGAPPPTSSTAAPSTSSTSNPNSATFVPPTLPEDFELTERQERELQENLTNWLAVMYNRDPQLTWSLGHQFDDMILRCTMKSVNCTHQRSFENSFTPTEGNCFTYRSKVRKRRTNAARGGGPASAAAAFEEANLAGTNHGLELVLNLEKNEYVSGSSQVGALVMIHHPSDLGYAASEATFVAPEFTTYIGLKMVNITRLPAPYPEYCVDSWPAKFADTLTRNSTYSQQACLKICLQKTIQKHCQCQSAFLPVVELDTNLAASAGNPISAGSGNATADGAGKRTTAQGEPARIIICDTRKVVTRLCVRDVMFRAADRVHNCECPPKCQVVRYDKTISMARWPTREDKVTFDRGKMDVNFQNLAKVIVYFQTMTCEEVTQQAVFNAAKLFSALGGIMGMYVGFSFLSVFEIFEVMSRKMWHHFTAKLASTTTGIINNFRA